MRCPACGSELRERTTQRDVLFLICSAWPECSIAGTPVLLNRLQALKGEVERLKTRLSESREQNSLLVDKIRDGEPEPVPLPMPIGDVIDQLAMLRVLQAKLNTAETDEERERIREQALEVVREQ